MAAQIQRWTITGRSVKRFCVESPRQVNAGMPDKGIEAVLNPKNLAQNLGLSQQGGGQPLDQTSR
jgi:hypothetical protein